MYFIMLPSACTYSKTKKAAEIISAAECVCVLILVSQEEHGGKQQGDDPCADVDFLGFAGEYLDCNV